MDTNGSGCCFSSLTVPDTGLAFCAKETNEIQKQNNRHSPALENSWFFFLILIKL
jgi:hypothetical protein